ISPVIRRIVVAVIVPLLLATVVPPRRLVQRRAPTAVYDGSRKSRQLEVQVKLLEALYLPLQQQREPTRRRQPCRSPLAPSKEFFKLRVSDCVGRVGPVNRARRHAEPAGKRATRCSCLVDDQPAVAETELWRYRTPLQRFRGLQSLQNLARALAVHLNDWIGSSAEDVNRYPQCHDGLPSGDAKHGYASKEKCPRLLANSEVMEAG